MPLRAIKHQLSCLFELSSGSFLIGRRRILVIPRNHLVACSPAHRKFELDNRLLNSIFKFNKSVSVKNPGAHFYSNHDLDPMLFTLYWAIYLS